MRVSLSVFRAHELNRILPMVRKTIAKERRVIDLRNKGEEEVELLEKIEQAIEMISDLPELLEKVSTTKIESSKIQLIKKELEEKKEQIEAELDEYEVALEENRECCDFENDYYKSVIKGLYTSEGFLSIGDIKEEYLEEYVYLMMIEDNHRNLMLNIGNLFKDTSSRMKFHELLDKRLSSEKKYILLNAIGKKQVDKGLFFKIFYN